MSRAAPSHAAFCLEEEIGMLFGHGVSVAVTDPAAPHPAVFAAEAGAIARARPRRQREFWAGRAAVREAMQRMGCAPAPVPAGPDRAPVWPEGVTGSLSHSDRICVAALASSATVAALGVDVEPAEPLEPELIPEICTRPERAWLSSRPPHERGRLARVIFAAKECAYKCQYQKSRTLLEFQDLEVTLAPETGQFDATFLRAVRGYPQGARLYGRFAFAQGHVVAAIAVPRQAPEARNEWHGVTG